MAVRLIVFDMGGVMMQHDSDAMVREIADAIHLPSSLVPAFGKAVDACDKPFSEGLIDEAEFWHNVETMLRHPVPYDGSTLWGRFFHPVRDARMYDSVQTLRKAGYRVVTGTNVEPPHYLLHQQNHDYDAFNAVYASCMIHRNKPDVQFYKYIKETEQIDYNDIVFVDDNHENYLATVSLGIHSILFTSYESYQKTLKNIL